MKCRFLAVTVVLIMIFGITVNAENYEYTISSGDNFISTQSDDDLTAISKKLNTTPQKLESYLTENNVLYIAVSHDNKLQIKISALTDNFSAKVGDISRINDSVMKEFITAVTTNADSPATVVENNGRKYVCVKNTLNDDTGKFYTVTQYITICNNKTFYFSCHNPGEDTASEIIGVFETFKLADTLTTKDDKKNDESGAAWDYILINCGVVIFAFAAITLITSIVITHFKAPEPQQNIKEDDTKNED